MYFNYLDLFMFSPVFCCIQVQLVANEDYISSENKKNLYHFRRDTSMIQKGTEKININANQA